MASPQIRSANFTVSAAAKRAAEKLRIDYDAAYPADPAAVLCVAWGITIPDKGSRSENVVVSYYQRSMLAEIAHGIQEVSGVKLVFFTTKDHYDKFAGKVLDFADGRGFFLRAP
jgi:hypothetical protein